MVQRTPPKLEKGIPFAARLAPRHGTQSTGFNADVQDFEVVA